MSDQLSSNEDLARTLGRIEGTLDKFDETLTRMDHRLFGNGQPGELTNLTNRLSVIEEFKSVIKGALLVLSTLTTLLGGTEIYHLFFGKR